MIYDKPIFYELRLYPTYAVYYKQRNKGGYARSHKITWTPSKTIKQIENEENLKNNQQNGVLSKKATTKLRNAINWLVVSAKTKTVTDPKTKSRFSFKINLITLTLPTKQIKSDNEIKKELLNPFLTLLKTRYDFNNYVWKAETQSNGNIHFHITSDCYIPHEEINFLWNRLLSKKGYMSEYQNKFANMTFNEYASYSFKNGQKDIAAIKKRFLYGKSTGWTRPNSTDVHAVKDIKNLSAYLASYMSKKEEGKRPVTGRLWGCSYALSSSNVCVIEIDQSINTKIFQKFENLCKKIKPIWGEPNAFGQASVMATVFMFDFQKMFKDCNDWVKNAFMNHIEGIRNYKELRLEI